MTQKAMASQPIGLHFFGRPRAVFEAGIPASSTQKQFLFIRNSEFCYYDRFAL